MCTWMNICKRLKIPANIFHLQNSCWISHHENWASRMPMNCGWNVGSSVNKTCIATSLATQYDHLFKTTFGWIWGKVHQLQKKQVFYIFELHSLQNEFTKRMEDPNPGNLFMFEFYVFHGQDSHMFYSVCQFWGTSDVGHDALCRRQYQDRNSWASVFHGWPVTWWGVLRKKL